MTLGWKDRDDDVRRMRSGESPLDQAFGTSPPTTGIVVCSHTHARSGLSALVYSGETRDNPPRHAWICSGCLTAGFRFDRDGVVDPTHYRELEALRAERAAAGDPAPTQPDLADLGRRWAEERERRLLAAVLDEPRPDAVVEG